MKLVEVIVVAIVVSVIMFFLLRGVQSRPVPVVNETPSAEVQVVQESPPVAPYWTVYGLPDYWPYYTSPYWWYGQYSPYDGVGSSSGYRGRRQMYAPHGWDGRGGYSGVAVGGGGGGGGGGGHGGR